MTFITVKTEKKAIFKKPDNVADHPNAMPYPTNVGAPAFTIPDVLGNKKDRGSTATHHLQTRFDELKKKYFELVSLAEDTELVYNAKYNFIPIIGKVYYLYYGADGKPFLSLIEPEDWSAYKPNFIGSFRYSADCVWERQ